VLCAYNKTVINGRAVYHQHPAGEVPRGGFPLVLIFHAWGANGLSCFEADHTFEFDVFPKAQLARRLLDAGFAVACPDASSPYEPVNATEGQFWWSNVPPYDLDEAADLYLWNATSPDHKLLMALLSYAEAGDWGPLDTSRLHAAGFSSGGYMVSRLARWQYSRFASLSINSGAMYYCGGAFCPSPGDFLSHYFGEHPPTLFLHGDDDDVVNASDVLSYHQRLRDSSVPTRLVTQKGKGHAWLDAAPTEVFDWIQRWQRASAGAVVEAGM